MSDIASNNLCDLYNHMTKTSASTASSSKSKKKLATTTLEVEYDSFSKMDHRLYGKIYWLESGQFQYPLLFSVYKWLSAISGSSAGVERLFSRSGLFVSELRASMSPETLEDLVYLSFSQKSINMREKLEAFIDEIEIH